MLSTPDRLRGYSLKAKISLPILLFGVVAVIGVAWITHRALLARLEDQAMHRAETLVHAVNYAAETVSRGSELQRFVSATAADRDVAQIIVVGGNPSTIIACSENQWVGQPLADLPDPPARASL